MRIAISNIAWDISEDEMISQLLLSNNIDAIDIAPGKYFPDPINTNDEDILRVKNWWHQKNIAITGMQALLFGTTGLNLFGDTESQEKMLKHLEAVCNIGGILGATRLVFGSPKNRDRSGLSDQQTLNMAVDFFNKLGDIAKSHGVIICLEPNPTRYGANFMTTTDETARVVETTSHPAIKMQLDTGALAINDEDIDSILKNYAHLIGHIHASEPDLIPLGDDNTDHSKIYTALQKYLPNSIISIEMLATKNEAHEVSITRALNTAMKYYCPTPISGAIA
jgi:D-psicose/D-tagatose/L-ribulose 3-epimerase